MKITMSTPMRNNSAEAALSKTSPIQELVTEMFISMGEDVHREGLQKTPERFEKALRELTAGYHLSPQEVVGEGIFSSEGPGPISVKEIEFFSLCEHHVLPFWGQVSISYLPGEKILGLSKLARIVELFSRRLQVQERLTKQIADAVQDLLNPRAVFVKVEASHMCMMMRGVRKLNSTTATEYGLGLEGLPEVERQRLITSCDQK